MFHLVQGVCITQSQWIIARSSKTPELFIRNIARFVWTKRGLTLRCFKERKNISKVHPDDIKKVITPKKIMIFKGTINLSFNISSKCMKFMLNFIKYNIWQNNVALLTRILFQISIINQYQIFLVIFVPHQKVNFSTIWFTKAKIFISFPNGIASDSLIIKCFEFIMISNNHKSKKRDLSVGC